MRLSRLFSEFFESEKAGGFVLIACTLLSLLLANSGWQSSYLSFWHLTVAGHDLVHWINDGLMAIFFLLIGLELEREIYKGELSNLRNALFPVFGALGGMLVPAGIYLLLNAGTVTADGAGIPMATDIAFAIGMLSLLGKRVPPALKVFLTALAVIDDLGAILVIAFFYSTGIVWLNLGIALAVFAILGIMNRLKVRYLLPYLLGGVVMWWFMLNSGVHATITGVMLAFVIPFGDGAKGSTSYKLQHFLHKPVSFFILPVFALANTCIVIQSGWMNDLLSVGSLGILTGLVVGKPLGILLFCGTAVVSRICSLPPGIQWKHIAGAGLLAGIGFTMSIFITLLAFSDDHHVTNAKMAILVASLVAAMLGLGWLWASLGKAKPAIAGDES